MAYRMLYKYGTLKALLHTACRSVTFSAAVAIGIVDPKPGKCATWGMYRRAVV